MERCLIKVISLRITTQSSVGTLYMERCLLLCGKAQVKTHLKVHKLCRPAMGLAVGSSS